MKLRGNIIKNYLGVAAPDIVERRNSRNVQSDKFHPKFFHERHSIFN